MKIRKNKGQMEIMGLAIIVILIALAMLFVIQFIVLKQPSDLKKTFTHKEIAANTVNTLISTNTDCKELSIAHLLEDCAEGGFTMCNGIKSCDYVEPIIDNILENTLTEWNKDYELRITKADLEFGEPCPGQKISSSPCCILPTGAGPMTLTLDICG